MRRPYQGSIQSEKRPVLAMEDKARRDELPSAAQFGGAEASSCASWRVWPSLPGALPSGGVSGA